MLRHGGGPRDTVPPIVKLLLGLVVLSGSPCGADEHGGTIVLGRVQVVYPRGAHSQAQGAAAAAQSAVETIRTRLGIDMTPRVDVVLVRGTDALREAAGGRQPEWAMAVAVSARRRIVVDATAVAAATPNDIHLVVLHEMTHLALGRIEQGRADPFPLWFHEGVAMWMSSAQLLSGDPYAFDRAVAAGRLLPFAGLERAFPEDPVRAQVAYLQSLAFVRHMVETNGRGALAAILGDYRAGASFDRAFESATGASPRAAERQWKRSLRAPFRRLRAVLRHVSLFTVLALVTLAAYFLIRRRAHRQRRRWDEEEHAWRLVPAEDEDAAGPDEEDDDEPWTV